MKHYELRSKYVKIDVILTADKHFFASSARSTKRWAKGLLLLVRVETSHWQDVYKRQHKIIRENLDRSPLYSGMIEGTGPRYCPSIEDKVVRFADKNRHQVFIEPEGIHTDEMYIGGMSSSLPEDVQIAMYRSVPGLEHAQIVRNAYAIEYDCIDARNLTLALEFKKISGLFSAGQFNGSSGYEEAAAQGLIAGINAARKIQGKEPLVLDRSEAYIGVLIDDLVTKENREPYRMIDVYKRQGVHNSSAIYT